MPTPAFIHSREIRLSNKNMNKILKADKDIKKKPIWHTRTLTPFSYRQAHLHPHSVYVCVRYGQTTKSADGFLRAKDCGI